MKEWVIEYSTNKEDRLTAIVKGKTFTDAYVNFTLQFPKEYEITEITEK